MAESAERSCEGRGALGGTFDGGLENAWYRFEAGGKKYAVITIEFALWDMVVEWVKYVAAEQGADTRVILLTHAYLYADSTRYDFKEKGKTQKWSPHVYPAATMPGASVNDGQELWEKVVSEAGEHPVPWSTVSVMPETGVPCEQGRQGTDGAPDDVQPATGR